MDRPSKRGAWTSQVCRAPQVPERGWIQTGFLIGEHLGQRRQVLVYARWLLSGDYSSPSLLTAFVMMQMSSSSALSLPLYEEDDVKWAGSVTEPEHTSASEATRKKAVIYLAVTRTERDHVAHGGGTLFMLSEEDEWMLSLSAVTARHAGIEPTWAHLSPAAQILCPLFFLIDPWEKENVRARGAELLSEKKANRERREARLKTLAVRAISGISPSVTHTQRECHQRAGYSRTSYNDGAAFATTLRWN